MSIYLDNMAATPVDSRVAERHRAAMMDHPGNAHSIEHSVGAQAQDAIDHAARSLLHALGSEAEEVTFTPGASAALWIAVEDAIARVAGRPARIAATAVEHPALLAALRRAEREGRIRLTLISVDESASPRLEAIEAALAEGVDLLCTMAANNEVGTVTDLTAVATMVARFGSRHLVDASQAAGHIEMPGAAAADLVVVSGAKIYGPRRAGALIGSLGRQAVSLAHDLFGSPDAPAAVALAFAMELRAVERIIDEPRLAAMRNALQAQLVAAVPGIRVNGALNSRLAGSLHVSTPHIPGEAAVGRLWGRVAVSTGAACRSGVPGPSHVLSAMDVPKWAREGAVRIGLGRFNTESEVEEAGELIAAALNATEPARRHA
ncbi:cysteine desulfurase family protein [Azospirillum isscasi]|uniref:Cysteine desulfurase n=1 Tax=Azospirillum isscasi TaxID=3053926 RepID=A0ABU0WEN1_9PROT|nr:aminotransferase class V-fold PLP-dependent enzyme [Azospirillum isscasi]MDQ2102533.1 aminotransferase class V-fold PLP-dependent enzyme [Azospirillum isscasi]